MLRQRSLSAIAIVIFAVVPSVLGNPVLTAAVLIIATAAIFEFCHVTSGHQSSTTWQAPALLGGLIIISVAFDPHMLIIGGIATVGALGLLTLNLLSNEIHGVTRNWALAVAAIAYIAVPLAHIAPIRDIAEEAPASWLQQLNELAITEHPASGLGWLIFIVAVTWITDTGAYLGGTWFGRNRLAPRLSPGKTAEGALIGTLVGTLAGGAAIAILGLSLHIVLGFVIALVLSIVGQIGDLAESLIKRDVGVKDMGKVIPGHGGMLDRVDALLFTLPVGFYLISLALEVSWP